MKFTPIAIEQTSQVQSVYESGRCDAMSHETPSLAIARSRFKSPDAHVILPEVIAKSYEAPLVREGDDRWNDIIRWTHFALVTAEELGITQKNVEEKLKSGDPWCAPSSARRDIGEKMGLASELIGQRYQGGRHFGEIYKKHLGSEYEQSRSSAV